jgi:Fur family transcriptional regulator, iron response regulator
MKRDATALLRDHGIQPSAQRLAVADYVLATDEHPSAEQVLGRAKARLQMISRATVYNTLNLLRDKGLLRQLVLAEGRVVFDCNVGPHHHFIDEQTGAIHDVPWEAVRVSRVEQLAGYEVRDYMVVMRGKKTGKPRARHS